MIVTVRFLLLSMPIWGRRRRGVESRVKVEYQYFSRHRKKRSGRAAHAAKIVRGKASLLMI